jgi:prevent-host-death family protein
MKTQRCSVYETKTRLSELLDRVQRNGRIVICRRTKPVAMLVPLAQEPEGLEARLARLEAEGVVDPPLRRPPLPRTSRRRAGALARFLAERE